MVLPLLVPGRRLPICLQSFSVTPPDLSGTVALLPLAPCACLSFRPSVTCGYLAVRRQQLSRGGGGAVKSSRPSGPRCWTKAFTFSVRLDLAVCAYRARRLAFTLRTTRLSCRAIVPTDSVSYLPEDADHVFFSLYPSWVASGRFA